MTLPAKAENVVVVRHALAGLATEIGMDEAGVADLKTVVTEACMNVAVHAYQGRPGSLSVDAVPDEDGLTITVRDEGSGIRPQADADRPSLRLGLSLIAAMIDCRPSLRGTVPRPLMSMPDPNTASTAPFASVCTVMFVPTTGMP